MRKALVIMSLALLLENTGNFIDGMIKTATFQNSGVASTYDHDQIAKEGTDPSGMASSG